MAGHQEPGHGERRAKLETVIPKEGSTGWSDTWMVSSKAAHPNCMYMWMDYITSPAVQAQVAYYFGEAPANPKACDLITFDDATHCDVFKATDEAFAKSVRSGRRRARNA